MRIYLSGPITGHEDDYMERFDAAEARVLREHPGTEVINPARISRHLADHATPTHDDYMAVSLVLLDMCTHIYLMDGWISSKGCRMEVEEAFRKDITLLVEGAPGGGAGIG